MKDAEGKRKELIQEARNGKYTEPDIIIDLLEYLPFKDGWNIEMKTSSEASVIIKHEKPERPVINIWFCDKKSIINIDCRFNLPGNRIVRAETSVKYENIHEIIAIVKLLQTNVWDF